MDCRLKRNKNNKKCIMKSSLNFTWKQAKSKYPKLNPFGDFDKDGVINKKDFRPFNKKKHRELFLSDRLYKAYQLIQYGQEMGLPPKETHEELKSKGYNGDEMRAALGAYKDSKKGYVIANKDFYDFGDDRGSSGWS